MKGNKRETQASNQASNRPFLEMFFLSSKTGCLIVLTLVFYRIMGFTMKENIKTIRHESFKQNLVFEVRICAVLGIWKILLFHSSAGRRLRGCRTQRAGAVFLRYLNAEKNSRTPACRSRPCSVRCRAVGGRRISGLGGRRGGLATPLASKSAYPHVLCVFRISFGRRWP